MTLEINLMDLKMVTNRLLDHAIDELGVERIPVDSPFYWNIPTTQLYEMDRKPTELDIGSLADDWELTSDLKNNQNKPVCYQLTEVAPLLRYIGEVLGKDLAKYGG